MNNAHRTRIAREKAGAPPPKKIPPPPDPVQYMVVRPQSYQESMGVRVENHREEQIGVMILPPSKFQNDELARDALDAANQHIKDQALIEELRARLIELEKWAADWKMPQ